MLNESMPENSNSVVKERWPEKNELRSTKGKERFQRSDRAKEKE